MAILGRVLLKKTFSLALIFNSLITLGCVSGILYGFYVSYPNWRPFEPYLIDGNLFWITVDAAVINIFPSAAIGRVLHTGRFLFHHYVYGFLVIILASAYIIFFTPAPLLKVFLVDTSNVSVNAGRFLLLIGITLLLDDLPDVSKRLESSLNWVKTKTCKIRKLVHVLQIVTGLVCIYCSSAVLIHTLTEPARALQNSFLIVSLFITGVIALAHGKRKAWLNMEPPEHNQCRGHH